MWKAVLIVMFSTGVGMATIAEANMGPHISWDYTASRYRVCENVCSRRILGNCVDWREVCDERTRDPWQDSHKERIQQAMNFISWRIQAPEVRQCIQNNTKKFRGTYAPQGQLQAVAWADFDALANAANWPKIKLTRYRAGTSETGSAIVERMVYSSGGGLAWNGAPTVNINFDALESYSDLNAAAEDYAGTILHEVLHQMGHTHPSTGDYTSDYEQGHFIVVAGDCVASNGTGSRLTGTTLHGRQWYRPK